MKIIALYGPQGCGKTEAASALAGRPGWIKLSFAGPLYDMLSVMLGCDARMLDKKQPADGLCGKTVRHALQTLGTEWGREHIGKDVWVEAMKSRILAHENTGNTEGIVIDDLRFTNEYHMLNLFRKRCQVEITRIHRFDTVTTSNHESEADWPEWEPDGRVANHGSVAGWRAYWSLYNPFEKC